MERRGLGVPYSERVPEDGTIQQSDGMTSASGPSTECFTVSQQCVDAVEKMGQEDFLYRFLYMSDPKSIFLRYYAMLHVTFVLLMPILKKVDCAVRPNILTQIRDIVMPNELSPLVWDEWMKKPWDIEHKIQEALNGVAIQPPIGIKKMIEDLYFFYMIAYMPGYLESFAPKPDGAGDQMLRVRSYSCLFLFVHGDETSLENNLCAQIQRTIAGAPRPRNTTFDALYERRAMLTRSADTRLPNLHVQYSTVEGLSYFVATMYRMSIPPYGFEQQTDTVLRKRVQDTNEQIENHVQQFGRQSMRR